MPLLFRTPPMQVIRLFTVLVLAAALNACSSGVDMPKGSSRGYQSARFVQRSSNAQPVTDAKEKKIHGMIQNSLASQFKANGLRFNDPSAELVVGYLVVYQDNAMTTYFDEYFGYGRDAEHISDVAHERGVIKGTRPDAFERAGLIVDVIDARTNKLVYRNISIGDIVRGGSDSARAGRINASVNTAIAPFFK
jgi:hypothetical protein